MIFSHKKNYYEMTHKKNQITHQNNNNKLLYIILFFLLSFLFASLLKGGICFLFFSFLQFSSMYDAICEKYCSHLRITYLTDEKIVCTFSFSFICSLRYTHAQNISSNEWRVYIETMLKQTHTHTDIYAHRKTRVQSQAQALAPTYTPPNEIKIRISVEPVAVFASAMRPFCSSHSLWRHWRRWRLQQRRAFQWATHR